jgi:hypothetical protein
MTAKAVFAWTLGLACAGCALAQAPVQKPDPAATEVWTPEPPRVAPPMAQDMASNRPSDAVALFDGKDLNEWVAASDGAAAGWTVADGILTVRKGAGNIQTRRLFSDYQLHLEWRVPPGIAGQGQGRGNSGVFLASTGGHDQGYELQILDCNDNKTYVNGQAASVYKQFAPLVNACAPAGQWQSYDVVWTAPRFSADGRLLSPAWLTAFHNGVLVHDHVALAGATVYAGAPAYTPHGPAPIKLQDHGHPVSFRNIWVRPLGVR